MTTAATGNLGPTEGLSMFEIDIASIKPSSVVNATSTSFRANEPDEYIGDYTGTGLTYSGSTVTGGTITGYAQSVGGVQLLSLSGMSVSAQTWFGWVNSGDSSAALNGIFGGADSISGALGPDTLIGLAGDDQVAGGGGADDVNGNIGFDTVHGNAGGDTVRGGQNEDFVFGDDGNDAHVNGNLGNDQVYGGTGNDTCYGGQGSDTVYGEDGADLLSGDLGNDILNGGAGADRFAFRAGSGIDWVGDFNAGEGDRIQLATGTTYTVVNSGGQVMLTLSTGDSIGLAGVAFSSFDAGWVVFG